MNNWEKVSVHQGVGISGVILEFYEPQKMSQENKWSYGKNAKTRGTKMYTWSIREGNGVNTCCFSCPMSINIGLVMTPWFFLWEPLLYSLHESLCYQLYPPVQGWGCGLCLTSWFTEKHIYKFGQSESVLGISPELWWKRYFLPTCSC